MAAPGTHVERLAHDLLDGLPEEDLAAEVAAWLTDSKRFRAFVEAHRDKIRKKLRTAADPEARRDVRVELHAAYRLGADRRIELRYEAYGSGRIGPDFTISFRAERALNLEVTRLRGVPTAHSLIGTLLVKLRQLPPGAPNALLVAIDGQRADALDLEATIRRLRAQADAKDEPFFIGRGFEGSRGFYQRFLRLGAVIAWCEGAPEDARAVGWVNRSARIAVAQRTLGACLKALAA